MKVVVTGAAGELGRVIVRSLSGRYELWATDIAPPSPALPEPYARLDLREPDGIAALLDDVQPDALIHAAALPDPIRFEPSTVFNTNVTATFNVVEALIKARVPKVINLSSETVLGFQFRDPWRFDGDLPLSEESLCEPEDAYGTSKLLSEYLFDAAIRRGLRSAWSLRPSWIMYPETYERDLGRVARDLNAFSPNLYCYIDVRDLLTLIELCLSSDLSGHRRRFVVADDPVGPWSVQARLEGLGLTSATRMNSSDGAAVRSLYLADELGWAAVHSWRDHINLDREEADDF